jgi:pleiotropic regulator 1
MQGLASRDCGGCLLQVWDMRTKVQVHCLGGHAGTVFTVATNSVDPQIITGSGDNTVKMWDLAAGKSMATLTNHKKSIRDLKIHPRELSFVSGGQDNIKKWQVRATRQVRFIGGSSESQRLSCSCHVAQVRDGTFLQNLSGHNDVINSLAINQDGVLVSCGDHGSMHFWDYTTGYCFQNFTTIPQPGSLDCEAGVYASTFDQTGTRLLTGEADKTIKIWKEDPNATEETHPINMQAWTQKCLAPKRF